MKIFLDSADVAAIKRWASAGILDGVTTNPTLLSAAGGDPTKQVKDICAAIPNNDVSVEVTQKEPKLVYEQAKAIAALASNIVVKIPCQREYYPVIARLAQEGVALNITLVFTLMQGVYMSKLGVRYISPFVGRWDDIDVDGMALVSALRAAKDRYGFKTEILAASIRHVRHMHQAIEAGADIMTVPEALVQKTTVHPLTIQGMKRFDADWQKLGIQEFPTP